MPTTTDRMSRSMLVAIVAVLAVLTLSVLLYFGALDFAQPSPKTAKQVLPPVAADATDTAEKAPAAPVVAAPHATPVVKAQEPAKPAVSKPAPAPVVVQQAAPAPTPAVVKPAVPVSAPAPVTSSLPTKRLILSFDEEAWVEIKDANQTILMAQMNRKGSTRVLEGAPPFEVVIGNAPNVRLRYNDKQVDLAPHTQVDVAKLTLK